MDVGVDTPKKTHVLVAVGEQGQTLGTRTVANTPEGWAAALPGRPRGRGTTRPAKAGLRGGPEAVIPARLQPPADASADGHRAAPHPTSRASQGIRRYPACCACRACSRSTRLSTFPVALLGSAGTKSTAAGAL